MPFIYKTSEGLKDLKKMSNKSKKMSREVSSGAHTMTQNTTTGANSVNQKRRVISASNHGRIGRNTRNVSTSFNQTQKVQQDFRSNLDLSDQLVNDLANDSVIRASHDKEVDTNINVSYPENLVKDLIDADEEIPKQDLPGDHSNSHRVLSD